MEYQIEVHWNEGDVTFSGSGCDRHGDIHIDWNSHQRVGIDFVLHAAPGWEWVGIKIARTQEGLKSAPVAVDTRGHVCLDTCFAVGPTTPANPADDRKPQLRVEDRKFGDLANSWFYSLGIRDDQGHEHWPDPKIDNPGGDSGPPGFRHGATWVGGVID